MDTIPDEIIILIFDAIQKITDKRQFLRTCIKYNTLNNKSIHKYEQNYRVKYYKINRYCVEKFTIELCQDSYFDMIPLSYIIPSNYIIMIAIAAFYIVPPSQPIKNDNKIFSNHLLVNQLSLLEIVKNIGYDMYFVCETLPIK